MQEAQDIPQIDTESEESESDAFEQLDALEKERASIQRDQNRVARQWVEWKVKKSALDRALERQLVTYARDYMHLTNITPKQLVEFFRMAGERPYTIHPFINERGEIEHKLFILNLFSLPFGELIDRDGIFDIYLINKFNLMLSEDSYAIADELGLTPLFTDIVVDDDQLILGPRAIDDADAIRSRYEEYLEPDPLVGDRYQVRPKMQWELTRAIIKDGHIPNPVRKIPEEYFVYDRPPTFPEPPDYLKKYLTKHPRLLDFQYEHLEMLKHLSTLGLLYPTGGGKTFVAIEALCLLKGPKLVMVPDASLRAQWVNRLHEMTSLKVLEIKGSADFESFVPPEDNDFVFVCVYHGDYMKYLEKYEFVLKVLDEMHTLPAPTYLGFGVLRSIATLCLTATPEREDGEVDIIWALMGKPVGFNAEPFIDMGLIIKPKIRVYIDKDERMKYARFDRFFKRYLEPTRDAKDAGTTIIYVTLKETGKRLAKKYKVPFISGDTPPAKRLEILRTNNIVIGSKVLDQGISDANVVRTWVLEGEGPRQNAQRAGRPLHTKGIQGEHNEFMTLEEYRSQATRELILRRRGMIPIPIAGPGVTEEQVREARAEAYTKRRKRLKRSSVAPLPQVLDKKPKKKATTRKKATKTLSFEGSRISRIPLHDLPIIDKRTVEKKSAKDLIKMVLESSITDRLDGLEVIEIVHVLHRRGIERNYNTLKNNLATMFNRSEINGYDHGNKRRYFLWTLSEHERRLREKGN